MNLKFVIHYCTNRHAKSNLFHSYTLYYKLSHNFWGSPSYANKVWGHTHTHSLPPIQAIYSTFQGSAQNTNPLAARGNFHGLARRSRPIAGKIIPSNHRTVYSNQSYVIRTNHRRHKNPADRIKRGRAYLRKQFFRSIYSGDRGSDRLILRPFRSRSQQSLVETGLERRSRHLPA